MEVIFRCCAGIDIHQKSVVACCICAGPGTRVRTEHRTFRTMTKGLLELNDWLAEAGVTHVAMESTGDYWKSVYNIIEGNFVVWVVNASHVKNVPGRKTDVKDSQWLAELLRHGLLRPSYVPSQGQREWRDLTRMRLTLVRERASASNRMHKALESCNIKLGAVASDLMGVSSRRMLRGIVDIPDITPTELAGMALGKLVDKHDDLVEALNGRVTDHNRFIIGQLLDRISELDAHIEALELRIEARSGPFKSAVKLLVTIPGVSQTAANALISEVGHDMVPFATSKNFASWLGVCPGNNQSANKRLSGRTRKGNRYARTVLVQAAHVACRMPETQYHALYRRIASHRGKKRGIIAVAHALAVTVHHLLANGTQYVEPGPNYLAKRNPQRELSDLKHRAAKLGLELVAMPPAA